MTTPLAWGLELEEGLSLFRSHPQRKLGASELEKPEATKAREKLDHGRPPVRGHRRRLPVLSCQLIHPHITSFVFRSLNNSLVSVSSRFYPRIILRREGDRGGGGGGGGSVHREQADISPQGFSPLRNFSHDRKTERHC